MTSPLVSSILWPRKTFLIYHHLSLEDWNKSLRFGDLSKPVSGDWFTEANQNSSKLVSGDRFTEDYQNSSKLVSGDCFTLANQNPVNRSPETGLLRLTKIQVNWSPETVHLHLQFRLSSEANHSLTIKKSLRYQNMIRIFLSILLSYCRSIMKIPKITLLGNFVQVYCFFRVKNGKVL